MTRLALLTAALLAWCSCAMGDVTPLADYHQAVVRVGQSIGNGESASGTGTLICREQGGLIITVAHVFEGNGPCWVDYGGGRRVQAQLLGVDRTLDLAALRTQEPPSDVPCLELADKTEYAPQGAQVEFIGFGGGNFRHFTANALGYTQRGGEPSQLTMDFQSISGDSGGPVLYQGKVVAVQWGYVVDGRNNSQGTECGHIQRFLTQRRIPLCRGGACRPQQQYQPQIRQIQQPQQPLAAIPPRQQPNKTPDQCRANCQCGCKSGAACQCGTKYDLLIAELRAEIAMLKSQQPIAGPKGDKGDQGPKGDTGPAGETIASNPPQTKPLQAKFRVSVQPVPKRTIKP